MTRTLKNRILLFNFLPSISGTYVNRGSAYPSTAILLIATMLKKDGYKVTIIDGGYFPDYLDQMESYLDRFSEEVIYVGMSVMTTQVPFGLEVSRKIKENYLDVPIVWGGPHATLFPEQVLSEKSIDIAVINEGANTALELAHLLQKGMHGLSNVKGIAYNSIEGKCVTTPPSAYDSFKKLEHIDFSLIEVQNYLEGQTSVYQREFPQFRGKIKIMPIISGLGCPFRCRFCINVILKRRYRFREAPDIVEEIKRLQKNYGVNTFLFLDEDFFINKRRVSEFLDLVEQERLTFNWRMWCRVDHFKEQYINREMLERLDRIGHGSLVMGGESGNLEILASLNKGITSKQIEISLRALKSFRGFFSFAFIL